MADNNSLDPAWSLGSDDPLRDWAKRNLDWRTGRLLAQDPSKAIDDLIKRGVPPPDVHAPPLSYTDPSSGFNGPGDTDPYNAPIRTNRDGSIAGNITSPSEGSPSPPGGNSATPRMDPLTPPPTSSLPAATPAPAQTPTTTSPEDQAQDDAQDAEDSAASKSNAVGDALSGFGKSFAGIKAPEAPKLPQVGTPSVRSPGSAGAPNLSNLMALLQTGAVPQSVAPALGRLLVQGKA